MKFAAILRQRCPRCLRGAVFGGFVRMNPSCPGCGLRFEREGGYFLGAMYYSYAVAIAACAPIALLGWWAGWSTLSIGIAGTAAMVLVAPFGFRISRVLWLHMDQAFDPR